MNDHLNLTGGQAVFGYEWKKNKLVPNPEEAKVRKLIYELFLEYRRKKAVASILNERGYRTRNGAKFSYSTIARLLRDPTAKGLHRINYTKSLGANKQWELKPEDEWMYEEVEPIISKDLWDACNQILQEQEAVDKKPVRRDVKLFTGVAFCHCGGKMYMPSNSPKYICQQCRNKIPQNDLEEIFRAQLKNLVFASKEITDQMIQAKARIKENEEFLAALIKKRKTILKEMGKPSPKKQLEKRFHRIEQQIPELEGEIDYLKVQYLSTEQIVNDSKELYKKWNKLTEKEKRMIIEQLIEKIVIGEGDITIKLNSSPFSNK